MLIILKRKSRQCCMTCMGELICRQRFRIKEHSFLQGGSNFYMLFKKKKKKPNVKSSLNLTLSRFNSLYFVHSLLQLHLWHQVCSLLSSTLPFALLIPVSTTNPEILYMVV